MNKLPTFTRPCATNGVVVMTAKDLPERVNRWSCNVKTMMVNALEAGAVTADELQERYNISPEEMASWRLRLHGGGPRALCVGRRI
jgi:hypothetical protein